MHPQRGNAIIFSMDALAQHPNVTLNWLVKKGVFNTCMYVIGESTRYLMSSFLIAHMGVRHSLPYYGLLLLPLIQYNNIHYEKFCIRTPHSY